MSPVRASVVLLSILFASSHIWAEGVHAVAVDLSADRPSYSLGETARISLRLGTSPFEPKRTLVSLTVLDPTGTRVSPSSRFLAISPAARDFSVALDRAGEYRIIACAENRVRARVCDSLRVEVQPGNLPFGTQVPRKASVYPIPTIPPQRPSVLDLQVLAVILSAGLAILGLYIASGHLAGHPRTPGRLARSLRQPVKGPEGGLRLELEREELAQIMREIEKEHDSGLLTSEGYVKLRAKYLQRLAQIERRLKSARSR